MLKIKIIAAAAVITLFGAAATVLALNTTPPETEVHGEYITYNDQPSAIPSDDPQAMPMYVHSVPDGYLVKTTNGEVGVYTPDGATLLELLPIEPSGLRVVDAEEFERGITVAGDEELARLIEDFSS